MQQEDDLCSEGFIFSNTVAFFVGSGFDGDVLFVQVEYGGYFLTHLVDIGSEGRFF